MSLFNSLFIDTGWDMPPLEQRGDAWVFRLSAPGMEKISATLPSDRTIRLIGEDKDGNKLLDTTYRISRSYLEKISADRTEISYWRGVLTVALRGETKEKPPDRAIPVKMVD